SCAAGYSAALRTRWQVVHGALAARTTEPDYPGGEILHSDTRFGGSPRSDHLASEGEWARGSAAEPGDRKPEKGGQALGDARHGMRGQCAPRARCFDQCWKLEGCA